MAAAALARWAKARRRDRIWSAQTVVWTKVLPGPWDERQTVADGCSSRPSFFSGKAEDAHLPEKAKTR